MSCSVNSELSAVLRTQGTCYRVNHALQTKLATSVFSTMPALKKQSVDFHYIPPDRLYPHLDAIYGRNRWEMTQNVISPPPLSPAVWIAHAALPRKCIAADMHTWAVYNEQLHLEGSVLFKPSKLRRWLHSRRYPYVSSRCLLLKGSEADQTYERLGPD